MPKNRKIMKKDGKVFKLKTPSKFRIGNRKSPVSAIRLSNAELEAVLADSSKKRHHNKARAVLAMRG